MSLSTLDGVLVVRILVGTLLGAIIGYERDIHGRPAGLRTHALVALASATFMVVSTHLVQFQDYVGLEHVEVDGSRIAASVVSGIGFLAGGAILRTGINVQGLTTAAGLWLVAAIGLCAGGGMYVESVAVTVIGVGSLTLLRRFEDKDDRAVWRRLSLTLTDDARANRELLTHLGQGGLEARLEGWERDVGTRRLVLAVRLPRAGGEDLLVAALEAERGVTRMHLEPVG